MLDSYGDLLGGLLSAALGFAFYLAVSRNMRKRGKPWGGDTGQPHE